jgi:hypothetical protein
MKSNLMKAFLGFAALAVTACQTLPYQPYAREVKRVPGSGGEIALKPEHRDEDRAKAQAMMGSNCGAATVKVMEEGEVVVGQTTNSTARQTHQNAQQGASLGTFLGIPVTSGGREASNDTAATETTTSLKEWNIKYECDKAMAEAPPTTRRVKK